MIVAMSGGVWVELGPDGGGQRHDAGGLAAQNSRAAGSGFTAR